MTKTLTLELDELDYDTIQKELTLRKGRPLPDGDGNDEGRMIAECIRDLNDYRDLRGVPH